MWMILPWQELKNNFFGDISKELTVSKIERDNFRYTRIDVSTTDDGIEIKMEVYVGSLEEIKEIRKADRDENITKLEMKEYRKMTGKLVWLPNSTPSSEACMGLLFLIFIKPLYGKTCVCFEPPLPRLTSSSGLDMTMLCFMTFVILFNGISAIHPRIT